MKALFLLSLLFLPSSISSSNITHKDALIEDNGPCWLYPYHPMFLGSIPSKTYTWNQLTSGDCVLGEGSTVTIWADGNMKFSGVVWTNHTHSGDQWHHFIEFQDYRGFKLFTIKFEGPQHMNDDGTKYNFGPFWQKFDAQFFNEVAKATAHGFC